MEPLLVHDGNGLAPEVEQASGLNVKLLPQSSFFRSSSDKK